MITWLKNTYPTVDFITKNPSIGACASNCLEKPASLDVNGFYPDLLIFHVGNTNDGSFERIIAGARKNNACELMMFNDFYPTGDSANAALIRNTYGSKYHAEIVNSWKEFKDYLDANNLPNSAVSDGHLTAQGNWLLSELFKPHFRYKANRPSDPDGLVKTYNTSKDFSFVNGKCTFKFAGNRIDAVTDQGASLTSTGATILIDGKKPSEYSTCYFATRPNGELGYDWTDMAANESKDWPWTCGGIYNVFWTAVPTAQKWTVTIKNLNMTNKYFDFDIKGSVTGLEGTGNNQIQYNGQMIIKTDYWVLPTSSFFINNMTGFANDYTITWSIEAKHTNTYTPAPPPDPSREHVVILAQGLTNADHTIELTATGNGVVPIKYLRVYRPFWNRLATTVPDPTPISLIQKSKSFKMQNEDVKFTTYDITGKIISKFNANSVNEFSSKVKELSNRNGSQTLIVRKNSNSWSMWDSKKNPKGRYINF